MSTALEQQKQAEIAERTDSMNAKNPEAERIAKDIRKTLFEAADEKENLLTEGDAEKRYQEIVQKISGVQGVAALAMLDQEQMEVRMQVARGREKYAQYTKELKEAHENGTITKEIKEKTLKATLQHGAQDINAFIRICDANLAKFKPEWAKLKKLRDDSSTVKLELEAKIGRPLTVTEIPALKDIKAEKRSDNFKEWVRINEEAYKQIQAYSKERPQLEKRVAQTVQMLAKEGSVDADDQQKWLDWFAKQRWSNEEYKQYLDQEMPNYIRKTSGADAKQWQVLTRDIQAEGLPFAEAGLSQEAFLKLSQEERSGLLLQTKQGMLERKLLNQRHNQTLQGLVQQKLMPREDIAKWQRWFTEKKMTNDQLKQYPLQQTVMDTIGKDALAFKEHADASNMTVEDFLTLDARGRQQELKKWEGVEAGAEGQAILNPQVQERIEMVANPKLRAVLQRAAETLNLTEWQSFVDQLANTDENNQRLNVGSMEQNGAADVVLQSNQDEKMAEVAANSEEIQEAAKQFEAGIAAMQERDKGRISGALRRNDERSGFSVREEAVQEIEEEAELEEEEMALDDTFEEFTADDVEGERDVGMEYAEEDQILEELEELDLDDAEQFEDGVDTVFDEEDVLDAEESNVDMELEDREVEEDVIDDAMMQEAERLYEEELNDADDEDIEDSDDLYDSDVETVQHDAFDTENADFQPEEDGAPQTVEDAADEPVYDQGNEEIIASDEERAFEQSIDDDEVYVEGQHRVEDVDFEYMEVNTEEQEIANQSQYESGVGEDQFGAAEDDGFIDNADHLSVEAEHPHVLEDGDAVQTEDASEWQEETLEEDVSIEGMQQQTAAAQVVEQQKTSVEEQVQTETAERMQPVDLAQEIERQREQRDERMNRTVHAETSSEAVPQHVTEARDSTPVAPVSQAEVPAHTTSRRIAQAKSGKPQSKIDAPRPHTPDTPYTTERTYTQQSAKAQQDKDRRVQEIYDDLMKQKKADASKQSTLKRPQKTQRTPQSERRISDNTLTNASSVKSVQETRRSTPAIRAEKEDRMKRVEQSKKGVAKQATQKKKTGQGQKKPVKNIDKREQLNRHKRMATTRSGYGKQATENWKGEKTDKAIFDAGSMAGIDNSLRRFQQNHSAMSDPNSMMEFVGAGITKSDVNQAATALRPLRGVDPKLAA